MGQLLDGPLKIRAYHHRSKPKTIVPTILVRLPWINFTSRLSYTQDDNSIHQPGTYRSRKRRSIEMAEQIPGQEALEAITTSEQAVFKITEQALLRGIDRMYDRNVQ